MGQFQRLFIAEKPSLAAAIAAQLPGTAQRTSTHYVVGPDAVTWCVGHVLEQYQPHEYDPALQRWSAEALPINPAEWKLKIKAGLHGQVKAIGGLLKQAVIVVNAGDPDREGQLLVDELLDFLHNRKPVRRVLVSDYNDGPIRAALANIQDNRSQQFVGWRDSALARSRFDWLFGINLSRAYTLAARRAGSDDTLTVGRVQTPTLAMVVQRDLAIENFKATPFYSLTATIVHPNGSFAATWRPNTGQRGLDAEGRMLDRATAQSIASRLAGKPATIAQYQKMPASEHAPLPYSLSRLQMAANDLHGLSAQEVLDVCQALYETHKLTTYPRTDCSYLSIEQHANGADVVGAIAYNLPALASAAQRAQLERKSPAFNSSKVTAHHAIVPTGRRMDLGSLKDNERKVYDMIARVYLAQFFPPCQFLQTNIEVQIEGEIFTAGGKTPISPGWRAIYTPPEEAEKVTDGESEQDEQRALPAMAQGDAATCRQCAVNDRKTSPPQRFTEKLLLAAMVDVHKYISDPAIKARLKEGKGIGTEATRAGIIEELKKRGFIGAPKKGSKQLISTPTARALIAALPAAAKSAALTGLCEQALDLVAEGRMSVEDFLSRNVQLIAKMVGDASTATLQVPKAPTFSCPRCSDGQLKLRKGSKGAFWSCSNWNAEPSCSATFNDARGKPQLNPPAAKNRRYPAAAGNTGAARR